MSSASDRDSVVRTKARALTEEAMAEGWTGPPFDMEVLASLAGLKVEVVPSLGAERDAALVGNLVLVGERAARSRRRFSIAHEIAHRIVDEVCPAGACDVGTIERLCNVAAAELVIPTSQLHIALADEELGIRVAMELAERFDLSLEVCVRRLVDATTDLAAVVVAGPDPDETAAVRWSSSHDGMWAGGLNVRLWQRNSPPFVSLRGLAVPKHSSLHRVWSWLRDKGEAVIRQEWLEWSAHPELGRFVVEAIPNPQRRPAQEVIGFCWWPHDETLKARHAPRLTLEAQDPETPPPSC